MKWLGTWWTTRGKRHQEMPEENLYLIKELRTARMEWENAQCRLDYVIERDQIDYAVFALEASEKRYEMLLRKAKRARLTLLDEKTGKVAKV
ncbi:DUF2508 family protein [Paenibacillus gansuensis]|uniref:DUF2508 family protein n=1 Tax=Paenibacillus gansuensis TaxID=306542 RepID=A0ABW5PJP6_9BACL